MAFRVRIPSSAIIGGFMSDSRVTDGIRYEVLGESTLMGAIDCVSQAFTTHEPLANHLGIRVPEFRDFAGAFYPYLIPERLSWVAIEEASGEVVGVRISEDYATGRGPSLDTLSPKFRPIFAILGELNDQFEKFSKTGNAKYVHMFMIAVRERFLERGIAAAMNRCFFEDIRGKGYTHAVTEPTGRISQHILRDKFAFQVLHSIAYETWHYEGQPIFAGLGEDACAMLMVKNLSELALG